MGLINERTPSWVLKCDVPQCAYKYRPLVVNSADRERTLTEALRENWTHLLIAGRFDAYICGNHIDSIDTNKLLLGSAERRIC